MRERKKYPEHCYLHHGNNNSSKNINNNNKSSSNDINNSSTGCSNGCRRSHIYVLTFLQRRKSTPIETPDRLLQRAGAAELVMAIELALEGCNDRIARIQKEVKAFKGSIRRQDVDTAGEDCRTFQMTKDLAIAFGHGNLHIYNNLCTSTTLHAQRKFSFWHF